MRKTIDMLSLVLRGLLVDTEKSRTCHSVQADITGYIKNSIIRMQTFLLSEDILEIEVQPHLTIFYGINSDVNPNSIRAALSNFNTFKIKFGDIGTFSNPEYDVLYISIIENKYLNSLNAQLRKMPNSNEYKDYTPHVTLAYLKPGSGNKYLNTINLVNGKTFNIKQITISRKDYINEIVNLGV